MREYLPLAYNTLKINPETQIKRAKDTRQFLIDTLLNDFKRTEDPIQRNILSRNISSLLDSQEKSSMLVMQYQEQTKIVEEPEVIKNKIKFSKKSIGLGIVFAVMFYFVLNNIVLGICLGIVMMLAFDSEKKNKFSDQK